MIRVMVRHMGALPPGQVETKSFPFVGELAPSPARDVQSWRVTVEGEVASPLALTYADILALPQQTLVMDVHCVTGWTRFATAFTGIPLAVLLERAGPSPQARFVRMVAYSGRQHDTSLPLQVAREDSWLVHAVDGQPLTTEHGGPLRVVTRNRYFYKSLKWVHRIIVLPDDVPGFWERESAYHNNADPLREERYDDSALATAELTARFRALENFDEFRRRAAQHVLIKANLSQWRPRTKDLHGLQLKACNFDGADLRNADFRGANLTLSKFFRADLTNADFTAADLEGVDFTGAILTNARLIDVCLAAARFFTLKHDGTLRGPKDLTGVILKRGKGLLEAQEKYLRDVGVVNQL